MWKTDTEIFPKSTPKGVSRCFKPLKEENKNQNAVFQNPEPTPEVLEEFEITMDAWKANFQKEASVSVPDGALYKSPYA